MTLTQGATPVDVEEACAQTGFSRFPVTGEDGEFIGYLHIKDVLETDDDSRVQPVADKWLRPLSAISESSGLYGALRTMQAKGSHMARVADDSGAILGVVMLEDVLEELVGEIRESA